MKYPPILTLLFLLAACTNDPFALVSTNGDVKVSLGQSAATKSTSEAASAKITTKSGVVIELKKMSTGKDETSLPGAYFGEKTFKDGVNGTTAVVKSNNQASVAKGTPVTNTNADGSTANSISYSPILTAKPK